MLTLHQTRKGWKDSRWSKTGLLPLGKTEAALEFLSEAQDFPAFYFFFGTWGAGKTDTLRGFAKINSQAIYVQARQFERANRFLRRLGERLNVASAPSTSELQTQVARTLRGGEDSPPRILLVDEAQQLARPAFYCLRFLQDEHPEEGIEGRTSIVLAGPLTLKNKLESIHYGDIIGRRKENFVLPLPTENDARALMESLGFNDAMQEYVVAVTIRQGTTLHVVDSWVRGMMNYAQRKGLKPHEVQPQHFMRATEAAAIA